MSFFLSDLKSRLSTILRTHRHIWQSLSQTEISPDAMMATLKRSNSKNATERPPRRCIACTEDSVPLIRPCRFCHEDYCEDCLTDMFLSATTDCTRMPPRCCSLLQIHVVVNNLTAKQANDYRKKFEEWITSVKTYCPSPTCSAFISERVVPVASSSTTEQASNSSLSSILREVIKSTAASSTARFFRGELDITLLAGYTNVVKHPIDLVKIQNNVDQYKTVHDLTKDMRLIVSNALEYNVDPKHPVVLAANQLFDTYLRRLSTAMGHLITDAATEPQTKLFACPSCHIAICTSCKQIDHTGSACDTSAEDHELAMLETFGYKRCPRCKAGVKKMYGCSHMQCLCGAHWCYYCQRPINECDGQCDEREVEDDEEEDEGDYDSEDEREDAAEEALINHALAQEAARRAMGRTDSIDQTQSGPRTAANVTAASAPGLVPPRDLENLDAGGGQRWYNSGYDFGEEPDDGPVSEIWACWHRFYTYKAPADDGINRGDLERIECNRCFENVVPQKAAEPEKPAGKRRRSIAKVALPSKSKAVATQEEIAPVIAKEKEAWECNQCRLIVCLECRKTFGEAQVIE